jgi:hypothetical protein
MNVRAKTMRSRRRPSPTLQGVLLGAGLLAWVSGCAPTRLAAPAQFGSATQGAGQFTAGRAVAVCGLGCNGTMRRSQGAAHGLPAAKRSLASHTADQPAVEASGPWIDPPPATP